MLLWTDVEPYLRPPGAEPSVVVGDVEVSAAEGVVVEGVVAENEQTLCGNYYSFFLQRDAMLARHMMSSCVRLSARLSVTLSRHCTKTVKYRITQTMAYDSTGTLVFCCRRPQRNSNGVTPYGAPNKRVCLNWRFSTYISQYLIHGAR